MMRLIIALVLLLAACATETSDPAQVVERYLQAKVEGDEGTIRELLCLRMEADLQREAASFASVTDVKIENMACQREGESGTVACTGEIVALYGTENTSFPLTRYQVVQEDGAWKWCGEAVQ
jgi:hypothetical protein